MDLAESQRDIVKRQWVTIESQRETIDTLVKQLADSHNDRHGGLDGTLGDRPSNMSIPEQPSNDPANNAYEGVLKSRYFSMGNAHPGDLHYLSPRLPRADFPLPYPSTRDSARIARF